LASQGAEEQRLIPSWADFVADALNQFNMPPGSRVAEVYWSVSGAAIHGILVRIRTALADLVAELIALTPRDQEVPDKVAADQVVQFVITGDRNVINYSPQHAADGGTNVTVAGGAAPGPVTVSGAHGSAIGSQTASGAGSSVAGTHAASGEGSSVAGGQAVRAGRDATAAGRDAAVPGADGQPAKEDWWARLRKRGGRRVLHHHRRRRRHRRFRRRDTGGGRLEALSWLPRPVTSVPARRAERMASQRGCIWCSYRGCGGLPWSRVHE
jgi:hypothetical protein